MSERGDDDSVTMSLIYFTGTLQLPSLAAVTNNPHPVETGEDAGVSPRPVEMEVVDHRPPIAHEAQEGLMVEGPSWDPITEGPGTGPPSWRPCQGPIACKGWLVSRVQSQVPVGYQEALQASLVRRYP